MTSSTTETTYVMALRLPFKMLRKVDKRIAAENRNSVDMEMNRSSFVRSLIISTLGKRDASSA
jgi:hypothetical protein